MSRDSFKTVIQRNHTAAKPPLEDVVDQYLAKMRAELKTLQKGPPKPKKRLRRKQKG